MEAANSPIFFGNLLENGKKRPFSYKIACKKFSWSGQGGIAPCPPKYATDQWRDRRPTGIGLAGPDGYKCVSASSSKALSRSGKVSENPV